MGRGAAEDGQALVWPVVFHPEAYAELVQARDWYEKRSVGLGGTFFSEIELAVLAIQESPDTWPRYTAGTKRFLVHRFPFAIIYRQTNQTVQIIAVMHLRRRPGYWRSRT